MDKLDMALDDIVSSDTKRERPRGRGRGNKGGGPVRRGGGRSNRDSTPYNRRQNNSRGNSVRVEKRGASNNISGHGDSARSLYVGNLSWETSWQDLKDHFRQCGEVSRADVMQFPDGKSKGCGLITFEDSRDADRAIDELTDTELHGRNIFVREDREVGNRGSNDSGNRNNSRRDSDRGQSNSGNSSEVSLYVGNIPWDLSWQDLKDAFAEYDCVYSDVGELRNGRARGWGIVKVPNMGAAKRAIKEMNEASINSREIYVRFDEQ